MNEYEKLPSIFSSLSLSLRIWLGNCIFFPVHVVLKIKPMDINQFNSLLQCGDHLIFRRSQLCNSREKKAQTERQIAKLEIFTVQHLTSYIQHFVI